jgi:ABC-type multidrug transport system fused ATPase/permease subunit
MGIPIVAMIIRDIINEGFALGPQGIDPYLIYDMALRIIYTGAGLFASAFVANSFLALTAARQGEKVRITYLAAILKQDASWLDRHRVSDISSSYEKDCATVISFDPCPWPLNRGKAAPGMRSCTCE